MSSAFIRIWTALEASAAASEGVSLNPHALHHAYEEIAERSVVITLEYNMLTMFESAAGEQNGQVGIVVDVRITHAAAVQNHGAVEQPLAILFLHREARERLVE